MRDLVFVNAVGLTRDVADPMLTDLASAHRVWCRPGRMLPDERTPLDASCALDAHVADLEAVFDEEGLDRATLLGWCSGASIVLRFAARHPERVDAIVVLNPFIPSLGPPTDYAETSAEVFAMVVRRPQLAGVYGRALASSWSAAATDPESSPDMSPELMEIIRRPFGTPERFLRYALLSHAMNQVGEDALPTALSVPLLAMTGARDRLADPDVVRRLAERYPGAVTWSAPDRGHYLPYWSETGPVIRNFLEGPC